MGENKQENDIMRPIGFVICVNGNAFLTSGKIYPYYLLADTDSLGDHEIKILCNDGKTRLLWMYTEYKKHNNQRFEFLTLPEFPEDINQWTEDDWFQYDLKYGE